MAHDVLAFSQYGGVITLSRCSRTGARKSSREESQAVLGNGDFTGSKLTGFSGAQSVCELACTLSG